jgi:hypothetical protein
MTARKSLIAEVKALYAEQWGFMSRQADDGRETNPYARLDLKVPSNIAKGETARRSLVARMGPSRRDASQQGRVNSSRRT